MKRRRIEGCLLTVQTAIHQTEQTAHRASVVISVLGQCDLGKCKVLTSRVQERRELCFRGMREMDLG